MKKLKFKTHINASAKKVWDTMLGPESYKKWVQVSWPGSHYVGKWKQGEYIKFLSSSGGGTLAHLIEVIPHEVIAAEHTAVILKDGSYDSTSDVAKGWVGTTETYRFIEKNGKTEVKVEINTNPDWEKMFNDGWPDALKQLKEITEE